MKRILVMLCAVMLSGCATVGGMRNAPPDAGTPRTFAAEYDRVLTASREAVVEAGLQIDEVKQVGERSWMIIAKRTEQGFTWGELVRLLVDETSPSETTVRVYTQKRVAMNVTAKGDYSETIFGILDLKLRGTP